MGVIEIRFNENYEYVMKYSNGPREYIIFKQYYRSVMFTNTINRWELVKAVIGDCVYSITEDGDILNEKTEKITTNETVLDMINEMIQDCYTQFMELKFINPIYDLSSNAKKIKERKEKEAK